MKNSLLVLVMGSLFIGNVFADIGDGDSDRQDSSESKKSKELPFHISAQGELSRGNQQIDGTYGVGLGLDKSTGLLDKFAGWDLAVTADAIIKGVDTRKENGPRKGSAAIDTEVGAIVQKDNLYGAVKLGMNAFSTEDTYGAETPRYYSKIEAGYRSKKTGTSVGLGVIMNINDHAKNNPNTVIDGVYIQTTYGF